MTILTDSFLMTLGEAHARIRLTTKETYDMRCTSRSTRASSVFARCLISVVGSIAVDECLSSCARRKLAV